MSKYDLTQEQLQGIRWDDYPDDNFKQVTNAEIYDQDRWHTYYEAVYKWDDKFFKLSWGEGSTEYQEWDGDLVWFEVEPVEKTVIVFEPVDYHHKYSTHTLDNKHMEIA